MQGREPGNLGEILKLIRHSRGLSIRETAVILGITHSYYACFESGKRRIQLENLIVFSRFMGVSIQDIIDGVEVYPEPPAYLSGIPGNILRSLLLTGRDEQIQIAHFVVEHLGDIAGVEEDAFDYLSEELQEIMTKAMSASPEFQLALYHHIQEVKKRSILEKRLKTRERNKHQDRE